MIETKVSWEVKEIGDSAFGFTDALIGTLNVEHASAAAALCREAFDGHSVRFTKSGSSGDRFIVTAGDSYVADILPADGGQIKVQIYVFPIAKWRLDSAQKISRISYDPSEQLDPDVLLPF